MAAIKQGANRVKTLMALYVEARKAGAISGYDIRPVDTDTYEQFYILVQPKCGVFKGHSYVLELKTTYGHGDDKEMYPFAPPYMHFITNVFHTNIHEDGGTICVDILKDRTKWMPSYSFDMIVQNILLLFEEPNVGSPFNAEASKLWSECNVIYKERKRILGKNVSIKELDEIYDECFRPYSLKAKEFMNRNDLSKYYKYFPQLNPKPNIEEVAEEIAEFEAMAEAFKEKKPAAEPEKKQDQSARWKKYQKK